MTIPKCSDTYVLPGHGGVIETVLSHCSTARYIPEKGALRRVMEQPCRGRAESGDTVTDKRPAPGRVCHREPTILILEALRTSLLLQDESAPSTEKPR